MFEQGFALDRSSKVKAFGRWKWTIRLARLGTVAATVLGASIGLDSGGPPWNLVIIEWCLGLPFSFPLAWHDALSPNAEGGPLAAWGWAHLALGASVIVSWTLFGTIVDLLRHRRAKKNGGGPRPPAHIEGASDGYLRAAELEVETLLGGYSRGPIREPRTEGAEDERPRRLLSVLALRLKGTFPSMPLAALD